MKKIIISALALMIFFLVAANANAQNPVPVHEIDDLLREIDRSGFDPNTSDGIRWKGAADFPEYAANYLGVQCNETMQLQNLRIENADLISENKRLRNEIDSLKNIQIRLRLIGGTPRIERLVDGEWQSIGEFKWDKGYEILDDDSFAWPGMNLFDEEKDE